MRNELIATRGRATDVAKWASTTFLTWLGVGALAVAIATAPADAKKRKSDEAKPEEGIADVDNGQPMVLVVSLKQQKVDVYRGTTLVTSSAVSTGMPGHATKAGVFSILEKQRFHHSNIYSGAPMPWMNRITWSGTALHAGVVPGYPASHGCIRLPFSFAPKLFKITTVGDNVVVARDRPAPQLIDHPALFQPLPPPAPGMVTQEPPQRQSMNEILPTPTPQKPHPGMLARADVSGSTTDVPSSLEAEAVSQGGAPTLKAERRGTARISFAPTCGGSVSIMPLPRYLRFRDGQYRRCIVAAAGNSLVLFDRADQLLQGQAGRARSHVGRAPAARGCGRMTGAMPTPRLLSFRPPPLTRARPARAGSYFGVKLQGRSRISPPWPFRPAFIDQRLVGPDSASCR